MLDHRTMILWSPFLWEIPHLTGQSPPLRIEAQHTSYSSPAGGAINDGSPGLCQSCAPVPTLILEVDDTRRQGSQRRHSTLGSSRTESVASRLGEAVVATEIWESILQRDCECSWWSSPHTWCSSPLGESVCYPIVISLLKLDFCFSLFGLHLGIHTDSILVGFLVCLQVYVYVQHFFQLR